MGVSMITILRWLSFRGHFFFRYLYLPRFSLCKTFRSVVTTASM